jgi:hypothetical protein
MSLEVYPKIRKEQEQCLETVYVVLGRKFLKFFYILPIYLNTYRGNIGLKYSVFLFEKYSA